MRQFTLIPHQVLRDSAKIQFEPLPVLSVQNRSLYDFQSIMHYKSVSDKFSIDNRPVIEVKQPKYHPNLNNLMGKGTHLSDNDIQGAVAVYGAPFKSMDVTFEAGGTVQALFNRAYTTSGSTFFGTIDRILPQPVNNSRNGGWHNSDPAGSREFFSTALSIGSDGITRLLWTNTDPFNNAGKASIRFVAGIGGNGNQMPSGSEVANRYIEKPGYRCVDMAATNQNSTYLLWAGNNGYMHLSYMDANRNWQGQHSYGPSPNWHAKAIAPGPNNTVYVLWASVDSGAYVWRVRPDGTVEATSTLILYPILNGQRQAGFFPRDIAVRGDGKVHIMFTNQDTVAQPNSPLNAGKAIISTYDANNIGNPEVSHMFGYTNWRPTGLGTGTNGQTCAFWNLIDGNAHRVHIQMNLTDGGFWQYADYSF